MELEGPPEGVGHLSKVKTNRFLSTFSRDPYFLLEP